MVVVINPSEGKPSMGKSLRTLTSCHAGRARSGEERVSGSRRRCDGRDRCSAQANARPASSSFLRRTGAVRGGDGWRAASAHHWGRALIESRARGSIVAPAHVKPYAFAATRIDAEPMRRRFARRRVGRASGFVRRYCSIDNQAELMRPSGARAARRPAYGGAQRFARGHLAEIGVVAPQGAQHAC